MSARGVGNVVVELIEEHRRPPADNLFCRWAQPADMRRASARPAIPMKERESFASLFADEFAEALIEVRR